MTNFSFHSRIAPEHLEVLNRHTGQAPVPVGALAKDLGLKVVVAALPLNISGLIKPDGEGGFVVKVNRFEPKNRQRFTIAHEIAHFLLHRDKIQAGVVDSVLYRSKLSSIAEAEANRLAADIVMPRDSVRQYATNEAGVSVQEMIEKLANIFGVSKQAMEIRLGG